MRRRGRSGSCSGSDSSSATHASMPELVPVPPRRDSSPEPSNGGRRRLLRRRVRGPLLGRGGGGRGAVPEPMPVPLPVSNGSDAANEAEPKAEPDAATSGIEPLPASDGPLVVGQAEPEAGTDGTSTASPVLGLSFLAKADSCSGFGKRANDLLAALDRVAPAAGAAAGAVEGPAAAEECEDGQVDTDATEGLGEVELSAASKRRADEAFGSDDVDMDDLDDSSAEDGDDDDDGGGSKNPKAAKSRRTEWAPPAEMPPGAPAVMPASEIVTAAANAASEHAAQTPTRAKPPGRCGGGDEQEVPASSSHGPRFRGLAPAALAAVRSQWKLHSLANVRHTSSKVNQHIAATLFNELRWRRDSGKLADPAAPPVADAGAGTDESAVAVKYRPTFQPPVPSDGRGGAPTPAPATRQALCPGEYIAEECVAGVTQRRRAPPAAASPVPSARGVGPDTRALQRLKKAPARGGRTCAALDEPEEGAEAADDEDPMAEPGHEQGATFAHVKKRQKPNTRNKGRDEGEE